MDYLLFIIILAIVIVIGYILSRPFTKPNDIPEASGPSDDRQAQYNGLLQDIKAIERDCEAGTIDQEAYLAQIEEKKRMAADLLRLIKPAIKDEITNKQNRAEFKIAETPSSYNSQAQGNDFCPQCGDQVLTQDKFCMHCGHRLQQ